MYSFNRILLISLTALLALATGCIKNDIPYPRIQPNFIAFDVQGQTQAPTIDSITRKVEIYIGEDVDIENVQLTGFALSPAGSVWPDSAAFQKGMPMAEPFHTTLTLYQEYEWTISAVQEIERYFTVDKQVGASTIDPVGHRVIAYVTESQPLTSVKVTSLKLAGTNSTATPALAGETVDFTHPVEVKVSEFGRETLWTIYIHQAETLVAIDRVDPWACVAWVYASAEEGKENGFEYRAAATDVWTRVPQTQVTHSGGAFSVRISGLTPLTDYVVRAYTGTDLSEEVEFTTEATAQLPNSDFEHWWLDGKVWCPWAQDGDAYWGTGNKGAATLGQSNTVPSDDTPTGQGQSACLQTKFVGVASIGKIAAGNIFVGSYIRTDGTNGVLSFGRPFTLHPTRLKGWMKYKTAPISHVSKGYEDLKGRPDTASVWIALIDTPEPFEIRTNPANRQLFDPQADYVVAYGQMRWGYDVDTYTRFEIPLAYRSTQRKPTYILLAASASFLGDFFVGGNGAVLYVDDFELGFD